MQWILSGMVIAGALILMISMHSAHILSQIVPPSLKLRWRILTFLICSFIAGYCGYLALQFFNTNFPLEILISAIFFCGALFVYGIISLTAHTLQQLKQLNETLELKVQQRTEQLNESNLSLTYSQEELVLQNDFLHAVINALPHPFLVVDPYSYEITLANTVAGYSPTGMRRTCHALSHGTPHPCQGKDHPCPIIEIKKHDKPITVEHTHVNELGEVRIVELHGYPLHDETGKLTKVIEYSIDITEKKQIENELKKAKSLAEAASVSKGIFLANMSHEIRTPMNGIIGMNHLAMQVKDDEKRQQYLETVQATAEHLLDLLNDILDFSKIEAGQMQLSPRPFHLKRLLDEIISTTTLSAREKGIELQGRVQEGLPLTYTGDDQRIRQILLNLVGNAIKFTRVGSVRVSIDDHCDASAETCLHFVVADTGIGIPKEKHDAIFFSFEQADNSHSRQFGGTGLGLAISRQLVNLMGGRMWVESEVGQGSAFHVELPLQPASDKGDVDSTNVAESASPIIQGLRILVVDDNKVNRDVASMILEQYHHVMVAADGLEALSLLAEEYFDLVLMDVQMPFMDGLTATKVIRAAEQGRAQEERLPGGLPGDLARQLFGCHVPIIAMTANAMKEDKLRCLEVGMDNYITKPFQPTELAMMLSQLMNKIS